VDHRYHRKRPWLGYLLVAVVLAVIWVLTGRLSREHARQQEGSRSERLKTLERPVAARDELFAVEKNTIEIFRRVSPSVVSVANKALVRDLFGFHVYEIPQGAGTGFVWDEKGHIVSNFHVVYKASAVQVTLRDGSTFDAEVVGVDPDHDLAVLRVELADRELSPVDVGVSRDLAVGQLVMAIGNPFGLDTSLSVGVVSALGRSIMSMTDRRIYDVIQTDAAINPGNSGGPLLDSAGRLIGVNTAIVSAGGAYSGIGFAVPVDTVRRVVPQLIAFGRVQRAGMGIRIVPDHIARDTGVSGVAVLETVPGGAAAEAGLRGVQRSFGGGIELGDIITEVDGYGVACTDDLLAILDRFRAGDEVRVVYDRNGVSNTVMIKLQPID
jgi:S1-C subfamily serine protease